MKDKVLAAIGQYHMLRQGDRVTVGLSGGADSVALLCVLHELTDSLGITLTACHINHRLRGAESMRDEKFCRALCGRLQVSLTVVCVDVKEYCKVKHLSVEEGARNLRYEALSNAADGGKIATAHTLSDSAETVLLNLARGTALDGLCGIPPVRKNIIRPLIGVTRAEVEAFLEAIGQDYVTDSSNLSDEYTRNRIRHQVIPVLKDENPAFEQAVCRMTEALARDRDFLERQSAAALAAAKTQADAGLQMPQRLFLNRAAWSAKTLIALHPAVRLRALKRLLALEGFTCDARRLALADVLIAHGTGTLELTRNRTLRCRRGFLYVEKDVIKCPAVASAELNLDTFPVSLSLSSQKILEIRALSSQEIKFFVNKRPDEFKNALDCDKIGEIFEIRHRRHGDRIHLAGQGCTKTFKNLMNQAAVPPLCRDGLAVLTDRGKVVWLELFGVCEDAALTQDTQKAILITMRGE